MQPNNVPEMRPLPARRALAKSSHDRLTLAKPELHTGNGPICGKLRWLKTIDERLAPEAASLPDMFCIFGLSQKSFDSADSAGC